MVKIILSLLLLLVATGFDIKKRMIPDWIPLVLAAASILPPGRPYLEGLLAALPFLLAGLTIGGIGGGDLKLMGAIGLTFGFPVSFFGLLLGLSLLILYHYICPKDKNITEQRGKQAYPFVPFLFIGIVISKITWSLLH